VSRQRGKSVVLFIIAAVLTVPLVALPAADPTPVSYFCVLLNVFLAAIVACGVIAAQQLVIAGAVRLLGDRMAWITIGFGPRIFTRVIARCLIVVRDPWSGRTAS